jgi:hypothetical protein
MLSLRPLCVLGLICASLFLSRAMADDGDGTLKEVPLLSLSDHNLTQLGQAALTIHANDWKHAETANFVYHFYHNFVAAPVAVEAEFYYHVIAQDLGKDTTQWERKSHIFIFETDDEWAEFQHRGALDPWTGGLHSQGSLFIKRNPEMKFKGHTLGHEVTHLVIERFFGAGVPLWLNEGYAEYSGMRCYAAFNRARGYNARPTSRVVPGDLYLPISQLSSMMSYPQDTAQVGAFYMESERLVRFLESADKAGFGTFLEAMSKGNRFETALSKGFGARFSNLDALDKAFKPYATDANAIIASP